MASTFAESTQVQFIELSALDIELVSGAEVTWGIQGPSTADVIWGIQDPSTADVIWG